ncbi:hypothetical protein [Janthinobacterium agaricidamnosum]|uniref:DUF4402 domain-containing protein n=1 Tax=Janthinobacterium agaricidamnosum NBRC 102515 = DSM 9628 TaxID=1349767 RepID=W0VE17_9BURK|nr:hypothetical protein [Janthinobacterium agaricidamnosum]CDG85920.1 hypothetical protein GJA_5324 [Janthinobacterium agaricidamnosum NBRC 102515 = DSM 9628]
MIKALLTLALGASTAAAAAAPSPLQHIRIDAGGVDVELIDVPPDTPPELSYRAQGTCQPEVEITTVGEVLQARHLKSCHGKGDHEGTVFTLRLSAQSSFSLELGAGGVRISGGMAQYKRIDLAVKVGGIHNHRRDLALERRRPFLVGAAASLQRDTGEQAMQVALTYGGISLY